LRNKVPPLILHCDIVLNLNVDINLLEPEFYI